MAEKMADLAATMSRHLQANDLTEAVSVLKGEVKRRGRVDVADQLGISTVALWQMLNNRRQPRLTTFMRLLEALELQLTVKPLRADNDDEQERFAAPRGGAPWSWEEATALRRMTAEGADAEHIARALGRTVDGVRARLASSDEASPSGN